MHNDEHHLSEYGDWPLTKLNDGISHLIILLAAMMMFVILLRVADVGFVLYDKLPTSLPFFYLSLSDIFAVFASFLAVLIAIEIFANITLCLRDYVIRIRLISATALMAIARKVIVIDFTQISPQYVYDIGMVTLKARS